MELTPQNFYAWLSLFNLAGTLGLALLTFLRKPGTDAQRSVASLQQQFDEQTQALTNTMNDKHHELEGRITGLEEMVKHMPTDRQFAELQGDMKTLAEKVDGMKQSADITRQGVQRIENILLQGGGK